MTVSASAPAAAPAVRIAGLTVSYRRRGRLLRVLRDVSLDIRPGEAYGLVGESGCGKTTVAMALMRHLAPNAVVEAGRIEFAGVDVLTLGEPELRALRGDRMAMVYQDPGSALNPSSAWARSSPRSTATIAGWRSRTRSTRRRRCSLSCRSPTRRRCCGATRTSCRAASSSA